MDNIIHPFEGVGCVDTWIQAIEFLTSEKRACNVVLGIEKPVQLSAADFKIQAHVDAFFERHGALPISTVATTIFPGSEFLHGGAAAVYEEFPKAFEKMKEGWGTYAMRLLTRSLPTVDGTGMQSPLEQLIGKMKRQRKTSHMRSVYEVSLVEDEDLLTDIPIYRAESDARHIRGRYLPCLSYLSFKLLPDMVTLTAMYRYHYYVQRALGNLFGLAQLLAFVASEVKVDAGPLICHSTYAVLDTDGGWTEKDVEQLIGECKQMQADTA